jgi:flavorubredoxin
VGIESVNAEVCTMEEVAAVMKQCSGFVVGSPTLGGNMPTPVKVYILRIRLSMLKDSNLSIWYSCQVDYKQYACWYHHAGLTPLIFIF